MTTPQWVLGVLFRPTATFARSAQEMRFGYWWILISVFTLETVAAVFSPSEGIQVKLDTGTVILYTVTFLMVLFDIQALLLWVVAKAFRWTVAWPDVLKYVGLAWSVLLLEDIATFYWSLSGQHWLVLSLGIFMFLWYLSSLTLGIRHVSGVATWKAFLMVLVASIPWRTTLFMLYYWGTLHKTP